MQLPQQLPGSACGCTCGRPGPLHPEAPRGLSVAPRPGPRAPRLGRARAGQGGHGPGGPGKALAGQTPWTLSRASRRDMGSGKHRRARHCLTPLAGAPPAQSRRECKTQTLEPLLSGFYLKTPVPPPLLPGPGGGGTPWTPLPTLRALWARVCGSRHGDSAGGTGRPPSAHGVVGSAAAFRGTQRDTRSFGGTAGGWGVSAPEPALLKRQRHPHLAFTTTTTPGDQAPRWLGDGVLAVPRGMGSRAGDPSPASHTQGLQGRCPNSAKSPN